MSIHDDLLAELIIQDIICVNSAKAFKPFFSILFDTKNMANFYTIGSSSSLTHYHSKEYQNSSIENNTS